MITFVIPGEPVAKGRARIGRLANGRPVNITPARTRSYENLVALAAQQAMAGAPPIARSVPVSISVEVTLPIPASWSQRKRAAAAMGTVRPTGRPDLDNFVKAALDGMNGVVLKDDSSVVRIETSKAYGVTPGLSVSVVPLPCEGAR